MKSKMEQRRKLKHLFFVLRDTLIRNRSLIYELTRREINSKYKNNSLGILWLLILPLIMISIYTFVFSIIFEARWGQDDSNKLDFALLLFIGLVIYNIFADCLVRSPQIIINHQNFVKKVIFPLEILPVVLVLSTLFNACVSICIWILFYALSNGWLPATIIYFPLIFFPIFFINIGISMILSAIGVYLRDIQHIMGVFVTILMFLSPIFYPMEAVPSYLHRYLNINPLSQLIEQCRNIMFFGIQPTFSTVVVLWLFGFIILLFGLWVFQKLRSGFADVI